jgi:hypothetical protein
MDVNAILRESRARDGEVFESRLVVYVCDGGCYRRIRFRRYRSCDSRSPPVGWVSADRRNPGFRERGKKDHRWNPLGGAGETSREKSCRVVMTVNRNSNSNRSPSFVPFLFCCVKDSRVNESRND